MTVFLKVTKYKYDLPIAVADSASELAKILGVTPNLINSSISHAKKKGLNSQYKRVEIPEEVVNL